MGSTSTKSDSRSTPRHHRVSRAKSLRRNPFYRTFQEEDEAYVWAAYQQSGLEELSGFFPEDLTPTTFHSRLTRTMIHGVWFTLIAPVPDRDHIPVGLIGADIEDNRLEPHFCWYPWASPRNKVETVLCFLNDMRRDYTVIVRSKQKDWHFFERMCQYGIMRHCGRIFRYFGDDVAHIWQTK